MRYLWVLVAVVLVGASAASAAVGPVLWGDADRNGVVNREDAIAIAEYMVRLRADIDLVAADVSGDGIVTSWDSSLILRHIADGTPFPAERPTGIREAGTTWASIKACFR